MRSRTYRAALYIRLSREDGDKAESDSVVNQQRLLERFAEAQPDIGSYRCYIDDGYSGTTFDRPGFLRMMADVYASEIDCVIVKDSSRFGRNASESGRYIGEVFPRLRVRYIALGDAIDSGRSQGAAIDFLNNSMRGMINEYYVAANSESICATLDMERRRGDFIGAFAKYGYKKDPADHHKLLIDEEAAEVVRAIYRMYLSGSGIRTVVRRLNDSGIPNPSAYKCSQGLNYQSRAAGKSRLWSDKTVRRILQDEMYIGNMVQGKFKKLSYKDKTIAALPAEEWIRVENTHAPIIAKEDFERVQRLLGSHAKASPADGAIGLFSGLLRCADCGHALIKKVCRNPNKTYVYYRCSTYCKSKNACTAHTVSYEKLYDTVLALLQKMVALAADADEVLAKLDHANAARRSDDLQAQITKQEQEIRRITRLMADLYPDYKDGLLNKAQYRMNKERFESQLQQLSTRLEQLKASADAPASAQSANAFVAHFKQHKNIGALTRPLLTELIEQITVRRDGSLEITLRFRDAFEEARRLAAEKTA